MLPFSLLMLLNNPAAFGGRGGGADATRLESLLEAAGWTLTPEKSATYAVGDIYSTETMRPVMFGANCFAADPREGVYTSLDVVQTLQGRGSLRLGIVRLQGGGMTYKRETYAEPYVSEYSEMDLVLSDECRGALDHRPAGIEDLIVVEAVLSAEVKEEQCTELEAGAKAMGAGADITTKQECRSASEGHVTIAWRTRPVSGLITAGSAGAPTTQSADRAQAAWARLAVVRDMGGELAADKVSQFLQIFGESGAPAVQLAQDWMDSWSLQVEEDKAVAAAMADWRGIQVFAQREPAAARKQARRFIRQNRKISDSLVEVSLARDWLFTDEDLEPIAAVVGDFAVLEAEVLLARVLGELACWSHPMWQRDPVTVAVDTNVLVLRRHPLDTPSDTAVAERMGVMREQVFERSASWKDALAQLDYSDREMQALVRERLIAERHWQRVAEAASEAPNVEAYLQGLRAEVGVRRYDRLP